MTTIVGIRLTDQVIVAADQQVNTVATILGATVKLIEVGDDHNTVIAVAGQKSLMLALQSILGDLEMQWGNEQEIYDSLTIVHSTLKSEHGFDPKPCDDGMTGVESFGLQLLIANRTGLYQVTEYRDVLEVAENDFAAIGSGREFAIGALALTMEMAPGAVTDWAAMAVRSVNIASMYDHATGACIDHKTIEITNDSDSD